MKPKTSLAERPADLQCRNTITLPLGLPGFPNFRRCELVYNPQELPFLWLQSSDGCDVGFIAVEPWGLIPDYTLEIAEEDTAFLGADRPQDLFLLNIVTVRSDSPRLITANLVAPLAVNLHTGIGKQVILKNHQQLSTRHVLVDENVPRAAEG